MTITLSALTQHQRTPRWGIKIGRLDFKAHGLLGTAGLVLLGAALCCSDGHTARYLIMASIPVTTT